MAILQKVSTCLWFDHQAEEAAKFYTSLIPGSQITSVSRYAKGAPMPEGTPMVVSFNLAGTPFHGLNGGPRFTHSEACSLVVNCDTQEEIDRLWEQLIADGGKAAQCFWLKDRFGVWWQIWPSQIGVWMNSGDADAVSRVMMEVWSSVKPDIAALRRAYDGN